MCTRCQKQAATPGYASCESCRTYWRTYQRQRYAARPPLTPRPIRERALTLLSTFVLMPSELATALDISHAHAAQTLLRLWRKGRCARFVSGKLWCGKPALRYRLREL